MEDLKPKNLKIRVTFLDGSTLYSDSMTKTGATNFEIKLAQDGFDMGVVGMIRHKRFVYISTSAIKYIEIVDTTHMGALDA